MAITHLEQTDVFDVAIKGELPTLVKFTADWCGPCKAVAPTVEELARHYDGRLEILEVDIDQHPSLPERYGVRSVPTFVLFEDGEAQAKVIGGPSKERFVEVLEPLLP